MTSPDFEKRMEKAYKEYSQRALQQFRAHSRWWLPLKEKIWADIEHELGRKMAQSELWMGGSREGIRIDYFYKTDAELESDKANGQQQFIVGAIEKATKKHVKGLPEIYFHSHQFIQEKCGGDYFQYFR